MAAGLSGALYFVIAGLFMLPQYRGERDLLLRLLKSVKPVAAR